MKLKFCLSLLLFALFSCNNFEYSPNQTFDRDSPTAINAANLQRLGNGAGDDTVRFILTGDTQKSHDETTAFYKKVNGMDHIDFVVVAGDLSEFGILKEMEWIADELSHLKVPYVAVIGNHDLTSKGKDTFLKMYGPLNYSFIYGGIKFICHNTNSREYSFNGTVPDIPWLKKELQPGGSADQFVAISHVPSKSLDFDPKLVDEYQQTFSQTPGFLASLHAHTHQYEEYHPDNSGIPYVITSAIANNEFLIVEIVNKKISFERIFL